MGEHGIREEKKGMNKGLKIGIIVGAVVLAAAAAALGGFAWYANKTVTEYDAIYPGVEAAGVDLSGMSREEALDAIRTKSAADFGDKEFVLVYGDIRLPVTAGEAGISYDADAMVDAAAAVGREGLFLKSFARLKDKKAADSIESVITRSADIVEPKVAQFASLVNTDAVDPGYVIGRTAVRVDKGVEGRVLDEDTLKKDLTDRIESLAFGDVEASTRPTAQGTLDLQAIYDELYCEPTESRILYVPLDWTEETADRYSEEDLANYKGLHKYFVTKGSAGKSIDIAAAKALLEGSDDRYCDIPIIITEPQDTTQEIESMLFRDVLSTWTTKLNTGEVNRTHNIDLASRAIDGTVVCPTDVFSYNQTVGPRTGSRGYRDAKIFVQGEIVDGTGGGICQLSSTLYIATLLANLQPTERYPHRFAVSYTALGQDATVAWNSLDYKFKNTSNWPIRIEVSRSGGKLTVTIRGTKEDDYEYKLSSTQTGTINYNKRTVYLQVGSAAANEKGLTRVGQKKTEGGITGYTSTTKLIKYLNGEKISETFVNNSTYKTQDQIVYIAAYLDSAGKPIKDAKGNLVDKSKPAETEKPAESEKPKDSEKPAESEKPKDTGKPAESEKPKEEETSSEGD